MPDEPAADDGAAKVAKPSDDPKERFRQALEAKNQRGGHQGQGPGSSTGGSKGSTAKAGGKREFRRTSG